MKQYDLKFYAINVQFLIELFYIDKVCYVPLVAKFSDALVLEHHMGQCDAEISYDST